MSATAITLGSLWTYAGPGEACGTRHRIIWFDLDEIITWTPIGVSSQGFTWSGPAEDFLKHFVRSQP